MHWAVDLLALGTACVALFFCIRLKKNYFLDSKFFIALANIGFIFIILQTAISKMADVPGSIVLFVILNGIMAASIGFASFLLQRSGGGPGLSELREFLRRPPVIFATYLGIVVSWTLASVSLQPFQLQQTIGVEGPAFYYNYDTWWLAYTAVVLVSFFVGPVYSLYQQSLQVRDSKVVRSMRMLVVGWTGFGAVEFIQGTAGGFSVMVQDVGVLVDAFLFVLISLALREPTLLGRIISGGGVSQIVYSPDVDTVVLYKTDADRRRLLEGIVAGAQARRWQMMFFVPKTDIPLYTAIIMGTGSRAFARRRKFGVEPLDVLAKGARDDSEAIDFGFSGHVRDFVDLGGATSANASRIVSETVGRAGQTKTARVGRIWALQALDSSTELVDAIRRASPRTRVVDLAGQQELFSRLLGLEHSNLIGKRVLLEYDPSTNFEQLAINFALEFQSNVEPVAIFTSPGSPVYRTAKANHNVRLFISSTQTSTPLKVSEEEVLIPDRDLSLLQDAVDKLLLSYQGRSVGIAIDLVTDLILSLGFDRTYGALSSISEMCEIESATLLVLVNHGALDERMLDGLRGIFRFHIRYDAEGLKRIRIPDSFQRNGNAPDPGLTEHEVPVPSM